MWTLSHSTQTSGRSLLTTMAHADRRMIRLAGRLAHACILMSLVVATLGCAPLSRVADEELGQATLLLFAFLPVLYWSGKRTR